MKLPTILLGPILRRVESDKVYIWIATSQPCKLNAILYRIKKKKNKKNLKYKALHIKTVTTTIQVGHSLYVHLLRLTPAENKQLPTNTLLGYNLFFTTNTKTMDLNSLGLLSPQNPERITYGTLKFPTFFINTTKQTNILYGSCRKSHGAGRDALVKGDEQTKQHHLLLTKRPNALFLIGDQIYADDIPDPLIPTLNKLGDKIIGRRFRENLQEIEPLLSQKGYKTKLDQIQGRQEISEKLCKFTSTSAGNHLFRFSEFAAMYLMNWSPDLWIKHKNYSQRVLETDGYYGRHNIKSDILSSNSEKLNIEQFQIQQTAVQEFQNTIPSIRRLMANTPTYMIFDDHDITDDWNLSKEWRENVWKAPLGRHVIANGLAAYWLFQGWGNDPESFSENFIDAMRVHFRSTRANSETYQDWVNLLWNYSDWHFIAPTTPRALFLDTRTQRTYNKGKEEGPRLLSKESYKKIKSLLVQYKQDQFKPFILISPAPVLEQSIIETFLNDYVYPLRSMGIPVHRMMDLETWIFISKGYGEFIHWILAQHIRKVVILAGDAHRGFSMNAKIKRIGQKTVDITQFTSSPIKNESFPKLLGSFIDILHTADSRFLNREGTERYIDRSYNILNEAKLKDKNILWKETINNLHLEEGSLTETSNHLGLLEITNNIVKTKKLK